MPDLRRSFEARRGQVERDRAVAGGRMVVEGIIECLGIGEATVDVVFPVTFIEMPIVIGGGGVAENQRIVPGEFPMWNVGVREWDVITDAAYPDSPTFRGCTLVVVVQGATEDEEVFESRIFWFARGRALHNPIVGGL